MRLPSSSAIDYVPAPTLERFMLNDSRIRAIRGPVGAGKTSACIMELVRRACEAPVQSDGVRRSKGAIVRNTLPQLKTTCLVSIQSLLGPLVHHKVSDQTVEFRMPGVEADWLLLPLDTEENIERLLSLEITYAWVSEFREILPQLVLDTFSRCGRYPSKLNVDPKDHDFWYGLVMETNSFSEDSPWFDKLELTVLPKNWAYFVQPGAREPNAENLENLPSSYYTDLVETNSPEWVEQYIDNRVTPSLSGQAVFRNTFYSDFHIAKDALPVLQGVPIMIGTDTGRHPAAVLAQMAPNGRLHILAAIAAENMGMELFLSTELLPLLATERFATVPSYLVLDPACRQRSQTGEESVIECCRRVGFVAQPAMTNAIEPRLRAVEKFLLAQRGGMAAILFDPTHCSGLILAMQSRYRYKFHKDGKTLDEAAPEKNHPWSDYCLHGCTKIRTTTGFSRLGDLLPGDEVMTPTGPSRIVATARRTVPVVALELASGHRLICTPDHLVYCGGLLARVDCLRTGDILDGDPEWENGPHRTLVNAASSAAVSTATRSSTRLRGAWRKARASIAQVCATALRRVSSTAWNWRASGSAWTPATVTTGTSSRRMMLPVQFHSTATFGRMPTALYPRASRSTIEFAIEPRPTPGISSSCAKQSTPGCMPLSVWQKARLAAGMLRIARSVSGGSSLANPAGASTNVSHAPEPAGTSAPIVVASVLPHGYAEVVSLSLAHDHRYYAERLIHHNCDALQYVALGSDGALRGRVMNQIMRQARPGQHSQQAPSSAGWT